MVQRRSRLRISHQPLSAGEKCGQEVCLPKSAVAILLIWFDMKWGTTEIRTSGRRTDLVLSWRALLAGCIILCCGSTSAAPVEKREASLKMFKETIYPLLQRGGEDSCINCHDSDDTAELVFVGNSEDDYNLLLEGHYFDSETQDGLLARVASTNHRKRMPKG